MPSRIPKATYRLQFNYLFTFKQAIELIDYWHSLGITDVYASPITKARSKSLYGYDVVDHTAINPEIGTLEEFIEFADRLRDKGMGLILDIVPNHMCISDPGNLWWKDVLENGPSSIYAHYFDILWNPLKAELKNKVFLPVLSGPLGKVIENKELQIAYRDDAFFFEYNGMALPVNPNSWKMILRSVDRDRLNSLEDDDEDLAEFDSIITALDHLPLNSDTEKCKEHNREKEVIKKRLSQLCEKRPFFHEAIQDALLKLNGIKGDTQSFDGLEAILKEQAYRLSYWRLSNDLINYRRFFDINDLACLHVEDQEVFEAIHPLIIGLINDGRVTGLRIDHIDGLYEPEEYLKRLQNSTSRDFYLIVEKILTGPEKLNADWPISGTSGYDYLNLLNGLFVESESGNTLRQIYESFIGYRNRLNEIVFDCKKLIMFVSMASELAILTRHLEILGEQHRWSYDFAYENLRTALRETIASFPVYRSYIKIDDTQVSKNDQKVIFKAVETAKRLNPATDHLVFDFIKSVLLLDDPPGLDEKQIHHRRQFVLRFQQLTGPVMAKGFEDTALYRSYPLSSLNDVGMDSTRFGVTVEEFHIENKDRADRRPHSLLATSTHDTKRSEDVRARINILSEIPDRWKEALWRWQSMNKAKKVNFDSMQVPDENEEYLIYQTLIGSWPYSFESDYCWRVQEYMRKAIKEAKVHTSWINPNEEYEEALLTFVKRILDPGNDNPFLADFQCFIKPLQKAGMWSSLSQTLLKMTAPGIPDFYQGSELWQLTLVDPDNRQPINFAIYRKKLEEIEVKLNDLTTLQKDLVQNMEDGGLKLFLIRQVLNFRKQHAKIFEEGEYIPISVDGEAAKHVVAFARSREGEKCIVVVMRFFLLLFERYATLDFSQMSGDAELNLPFSVKGSWRDVIGGKQFKLDDTRKMQVGELFGQLPFVLLTNVD